MDRRPMTGETVIHPTYGERQVIADKLENGEGWAKFFYDYHWRHWPVMEKHGWRIKEDKRPKYAYATAGQAIKEGQILHIEGNREQPQWPDALYNAVKYYLNNNVNDGEEYDEVDKLYSAERRRREPQVCGAEHPEMKGHHCEKPSGHALPHMVMYPPDTGHHSSYWYDPPQCEREHMTAVALQIIGRAREIAEAHADAVIDIHNDPDCCECGLVPALKAYDREARS